jgi:phosphoserine phosphatase RsbU/P
MDIPRPAPSPSELDGRVIDEPLAQAIVDGMAVGLSVIDRQFRIRKSNLFVANWLKRSLSEIQGQRCHQVFHERATPCPDCPCAITFRTGESVSVSHTGIDATGSITHAEITSQPIRDERGEVVMVVESVRDVSERVRFEADVSHLVDSLRISEERLRLRGNELEVLNAICSAVNRSLDLGGVLEGALDGALRLAGLRGMGGIFLLDEAMRELRLAAHRGLDEAFVARERCVKLGECLCGSAALSGEIVLSACSTEDPRHTRFRESTAHGHIIIPLVSHERILGVLFLYVPVDYRPEPDREALFTMLGLQVGIAIENALLYQRTDAQLKRTVGELTRALANAERERARALANERAKDDLVAMVSHDLRSPLTLIEMAASAGTLDGRRSCTACAATIQLAARRMTATISDLVDTSRLESGRIVLRREPVALDALLLGILERCVSGTDRERLLLDRPEEGVVVIGDRSWLERALLSIVANSLKLAPVETAVRIALASAAGEATITIRDQGPGIPTEDLPHLFERSFRAGNGRNVKGSALGLFIARTVAKAHGGRISVQSSPGQGAVFVLTLPLGPGPTRAD